MGGVTSALTGILPIISGVTRLVSLVDTFSGEAENRQRKELRAQQDLALQQLQDRQALQENQLAYNNGLEKEQIALNAQKAEEERRAALRRAVSRQRAVFGSQGIGSNGGSSEAVLLGLFEESEQEKSRREALDKTRTAALDSNLSNTRSLNLLQATQLAERQKLSRYYV